MYKRKLLIYIFILLFLSGCAMPNITGIENYTPYDCTVELSYYLFPSHDFLDRFHFIEGDYQYKDNGDIIWGDKRAIAYLKYSADEYKKAKQYCLEYFVLSDNFRFAVEDFYFIEHLCHDISHKDESNAESGFPKWFNMFAYNDQRCILVFLGYYNGDPNDPEKEIAYTDFSRFIELAFGDVF